jgi:uncharacterized membrane protein
MSSRGPDLDRYKPPDVSQEEWDEIITDLEERKTDNANHQTVQIKLKKAIKYVVPILLIPVIGIGYFLAIEYQALLTTGAGFIIVLLFLYYASVEQAAGES